MIRNTTRNQKLGWVLFIAYLALLVYFMFLRNPLGAIRICGSIRIIWSHLRKSGVFINIENYWEWKHSF